MALIELEDVSININQQTIVKDVSLMINPNEFAFLLGKVGSGKTSIFRAIIADLPIDNGTIHAFGFQVHHIKKKNIPLLRRKIGMVFQDFQLLTDRNVFSNLSFVLEATGWKNKLEISAHINQILDSLRILHLAEKRPHELSGGEKQKTAIARALLNSPEIILADEPTGNLDEEAAHEIMEIFRSLKIQNETSLLIATHNTSIAEKYADTIYKIDANKKLHQLR